MSEYKQKTLYLIVGPQGSGKSTLYEKEFSHCVRVSQDDQGKQGHKDVFFKALRGDQDIYVDRINHTREQRERYSTVARHSGFKIKIIVLQEPFCVCYARIMDRKDHPTLKQDKQQAFEALTMFYFQYQKPKKDEADEIEFRGTDEQFLWDITEFTKNKRVIIIGDVHGMGDEVTFLLKKCRYVPIKDVLIFTGDLVDRGPKIAQVLLEYVGSSDHEAYSVMGNHEYKFARWLAGRKVNTRGMVETIEQTSRYSKELLMKAVMDFPFAIKFRDKSYVVHAGINPDYAIEDQYKDDLFYTRNIKLGDLSAPWWKFYDGDNEIFFGHEVVKDKIQVSDKAFAMDGGACFGMELRACIYNPDGTKQFVTQPAARAYAEYRENWSAEREDAIDNSKMLEEFENRVKEGLLVSKAYKDLILYNYTIKCTFDKQWDAFTRKARGIIFDKITGELVTWVPEKFFNVNEMPETLMENLPIKEGYNVFEKVDGSFVSVSHWKRGDEWIIATRGSFESEQAKVARSILSECFEDRKGQVWNSFEILNKNYSYIFEVIYPENRFNDGARLVVDYGTERTLVGLTIFDKKNNKELSWEECISEFAAIRFRMAKKYLELDIDKVYGSLKTLPVTQEGFVVQFNNGLRVKFKGEEYIRMNKILNSINIKSVWEVMENGIVPINYVMSVPEEIRADVEAYKKALEENYRIIYNDAEAEQKALLPIFPKDQKDKEAFKTIAFFMKENSNKFKYPMLVFSMVRKQDKEVASTIHRLIRPRLGD